MYRQFYAFSIVFFCVANVHAIYCFLSLTASDAAPLTSIVQVILFSTFINRIVEVSMAERTYKQSFNLLSMGTNVFGLFVASVLLETISIGFRSVSLGFRFLANIAAGHVMCDLAQCIKFYMFGIFQLDFLMVTSILMTLLTGYEVFVACIQCVVYIALTQVYAELS